jgi:hypothetical protein
MRSLTKEELERALNDNKDALTWTEAAGEVDKECGQEGACAFFGWACAAALGVIAWCVIAWIVFG